LREREAFITASVMTVMRGERIIVGRSWQRAVLKGTWSMDHGSRNVKRRINRTAA
jgi:hypothetical protein